jgi:hypothetical protein
VRAKVDVADAAQQAQAFALRLLRQAAAWAEDKAVQEVERLEGPRPVAPVRFVEASSPAMHVGFCMDPEEAT